MKKKLLSLALALALSLSLAVPAFAAEEDKTDAAPTETAGDKKDETPAEGEEKKDEAEAPLARQVSMNARLLQQVYELDKAVNLKLNREKSIYHSK